MIKDLLDYYIDYEKQTRFAESSLSDKVIGEHFDRDTISDSLKINKIIKDKKYTFIKEKMLYFLRDPKQNNTEPAHLNHFINMLLDGLIELDNFLEQFEFKYKDNKNFAKSQINETLNNQKITICYPLLQKKYSDKSVTTPLITFECTLEPEKVVVDNFIINRNGLEVIAAWTEHLSIHEVTEVRKKEVTEIMNAMKQCQQSNITEILVIYNKEFFQRFKKGAISDIIDFTNYENWQMLNQVFITEEQFGEIIEPIFRKELTKLSNLIKVHPSSILTKYLEGSKIAKSIGVPLLSAPFHFGSYTDKYPVNEKQWHIVGALEQSEFLAVNGPPGTGKTTLLKELIADSTVKKAAELIRIWNEPWKTINISGKGVFVSPMNGRNPNSIIITSTNNLAVDNIGQELRNDIPYFSSILKTLIPPLENASGLFCAKLGKKDNMDEFRGKMAKILMQGLRSINEEASEDSLEIYQNKYSDLENIRDKLDQLFKSKEELQLQWPNLKWDKNTIVLTIEELQSEISKNEQKILQLESDSFLKKTCISDQSKLSFEIIAKLKEIENLLPSLREQLKIGYENLKLFSDRYKRKILSKIIPSWRKFLKDLISETYIREEIIAPASISKNKAEKEIIQLKANITEIEANTEALGIEVQELDLQADNLSLENQQILKKNIPLKAYVQYAAQLENDLQCGQKLWTGSRFELSNSLFICKKRYDLFLDSLRVLEQYVIKHRASILSNLEKITGHANWFQPFYSENHNRDAQNEKEIKALWETFFLCFPVVTTTLHSFKEDIFQLLPGYIDTLFVDEAGQILPHYMCGPLYRSRRAIIVGDIAQLEPIRNLKANLIASYPAIPESIHDELCVEKNSVQHYSDRNSDWYEEMSQRRVGLILTEHRRCETSIIAFSNRNVYENRLTVINKNNHDKLFKCNLIAFDVRGLKNSYNVNQMEVEICRKLVDSYKEKYGPEVIEDIAIITPFSNQAVALSKFIPGVQVGTVHTFQGQEKKYVIFSMVIDSTIGKQSGLARFIGGSSNLLNVALSRAKEQFIFVGNLDVIQNLNVANHLKNVQSIIMELGSCYSPYEEKYTKGIEGDNLLTACKLYSSKNALNRMDIRGFGKYISEKFPEGIILEPKEHYELLLQALQLAKKSIVIVSPWMHYTVLDEQFQKFIQEALKRNVKVRIGFGYIKTKYSLSDIDNIVKVDNAKYAHKEETAASITSLHQILKNDLYYVPPIHSKILLIDDEYLFLGSHNWLSNRGKRNRDEVSCLLTGKHSIEYVEKRYLNKLLLERGVTNYSSENET